MTKLVYSSPTFASFNENLVSELASQVRRTRVYCRQRTSDEKPASHSLNYIVRRLLSICNKAREEIFMDRQDDELTVCAACRSRCTMLRNPASEALSCRPTTNVFVERRDSTSRQERHCTMNYGKYSRLRLSSNFKLLFASLFIIFVIHNRHLTDAAVTRVPHYFLDFQDVIEKSRCTVREEVIDVRKEHPTLLSEAIYTPSCVALNRCSGCCSSDLMQCVPTSVYKTRMEIDQEIQFPFSVGTIVLEFTQHVACECRSLDDTTPVCVQKECEDGEKWDPGGCSCVITLDMICFPRLCNENEIWNDETCQCLSSCQSQNCYPGERWNSSLCSCVPICPEVRRCPYGQTWNIRQCNCEVKCPAQSCGALQIWNPETCRCQCKLCHTSRLYHERFIQNPQTCRCACRSKHKHVEACRKRGAEFNTKTCTCERNHANRGRRR